MTRGYSLMLLAALMILAAMVEVCRAQQADGAGGAGGAQDGFARQAADMLDNTLLSFKNSINSMFEDGSKLGSFFTNVTTHIKKLTGGEKEST